LGLLNVEMFLAKYMLERTSEVGYLNIHQLLEQVPALGRDIIIPDYCYTGEEGVELDINVWIVPGGQSGPVHTDKKHYLLCRVVGAKYVAIFYPE
jgi:lysine-specific demethylase 8